jgi:hypothetical protein
VFIPVAGVAAAAHGREDAYLFRPRLRGLSVKLRDAGTLDVKCYLGSPGILDLPGRGRGRLESWRKWSFPYDPQGQEAATPAGWVIVRKRRRSSWFPLAAGQDPAPGPQAAAPAGCAVELTETEVGGEPWWSVGFEATGSAPTPGSALRHAAGLVFAQPLPAGVGFSLENSWSCTEWLLQQR